MVETGKVLEGKPPHAPDGHPSVTQGKVGLLLVNLGTPDGTDYKSVRRYLSEFLSDPRIIEVSPLIWQPILQGPILTFRPKKSGEAYKKIWTDEGSPLLVYTKRQAEMLNARIGSERLVVDFAMTYGNPSIASKIEALKAKGCDRIAVVALYPQYSATTSASVYDRSFDALKDMRWQPAVRTAAPFHDHPAYIEALAASVSEHIASLDFEPERVLMSYHGIPKAYFEKGDPYHCHCHKTTRLVSEKLGWADGFAMTTFQSRFGPTEWLQPYTDKTLEALPEQGVKKVVAVSPAFISDCLETLEEIAMEGRDSFMEAGGTHFSVAPCLNDSDRAIDLLETLAARELAGWI
ncbi:ferrochelatase [Henriciella barbarensis]|uniref:Ferrochelatase n=1 Tax=Henriciella barbarensis TaxID=86342 RepID=A0A399QUL8_9PROT|nr:ferrochelatase [Henriciella barbarensis]RIJ21282.1 ferrochelatase [Henriciella barbarensis]